MARKKSAKPVAQAPSSGETPLAVPDKVRRSGKSIIALTVKEILDEEIAKKLA
jgi:hypothetical protein